MHTHPRILDLLKRKDKRELLEAVLRHHTLKTFITPKRKIKERQNKEFRLTSREGVVKHLMAALAVEWYPVSTDSVDSLLETGHLHQALQSYFEKLHSLSVEERVAEAWNFGVTLMSNVNGGDRGKIQAALLAGAASSSTCTNKHIEETLRNTFSNRPGHIPVKVLRNTFVRYMEGSQPCDIHGGPLVSNLLKKIHDQAVPNMEEVYAYVINVSTCT